jgi:predicted ATPase
MVTSRERLNLPGEWVLPVEGLAYPQDDRATAVEAYSAVELFVQQARQSDAAFELSEGDKHHVAHICQMLAGMPLGLVLAAAWVKKLPCAEIERELGRDLGSLRAAARSRQIPERHRSLRAVFAHSWQRLSETERVAFQQLAVFCGGFRQEAAAQIAGASLRVLSQLVDKSLVRRDASGRYDLHELLKQYAIEKLIAAPAEAERTRAWHSAYYLNLLGDMEADIQGRDQLAALNYLRAESENVRAAWQWAIDHRQIEALLRATPILEKLDVWAGGIRAMDDLLRWALNIVRQWHTADTSDQAVTALSALLMAYGAIHDTDALARTLERTPQLTRDSLALIRARPADPIKAQVLTHLLWAIEAGDPATAQSIYGESRAILAAAGEQWRVAEVDLIWANVHSAADPDQARQLYQRSLDFFTACGDRISAGDCLGGLARLHDRSGNSDEAARLWRERLAIAQETGNQWTELMMWAVLGRQATRLGNYEEAKFDHRNSLAIVQYLGHPRMTADQLNDLALAELLSGELEPARQHLMASLQLLSRLDDPTGLVEAYNILGDLAAAQGDLQQAHQCYQTMLNHANALSPDDYTQPTCRAQALTSLGQVSMALDDDKAAREYLSEAVQLIPQIPPQWLYSGLDTLAALAHLDARAGQPLRAIELLTFVAAHPLTYHHARIAAQQRLDDLLGQVTLEKAHAAQQRGASSTFNEMVSRL